MLMKNKHAKDITRRVNVVIGQLHGIRRMLEQQRKFTDIYVQLSSAKASIEKVEVMLLAEDRTLDKRSASLLQIMSRRMDALKELHW